MDKKALEQVLRQDHVPPADENARKRAVNLAVAAFKAEQMQKDQKSSQGISILSRLMGSSNTMRGRNPMETKMKSKLMYGGMATALAVVFVAGISFNQLGDAVQRFDVAQNVQPQTAQLQMMQFGGGGSTPGATEGATPAYIQAVEEQNEAELEHALKSGSSTLPVPAAAPTDRLVVPEERQKGRGWVGGEKKQLADNKGDAMTSSNFAVAPAQDRAAPEAAPMKMEMDAGAAGALAKTKESVIGYVGQNVIVGSPPVDTVSPYYRDEGRDQFTKFEANPFKQVAVEPVSTFSSDVDTASYSFVRRMLNNGQWPQKDSVRVEEMINYFPYSYPVPESASEPFKPTVTVMDSPWTKGRKLLHVGIKGYEITAENPHTNLVFLLDVSGSMDEPSKLPLVKSSIKMLLDSLKPDDTIAISVYAGAAGTVLEPTKVSEKSKILSAIDSLTPGGSTAGEAGIKLAYDLAAQNFDKNGVNRIILATDGDFNVGTSSTEELKSLVEEKRKSGIFLSVLGFGQGNYNDAIMQTLAQNGNGTAAYIDTLNEARKVLVEEASSSLFPIAKDVKFQVEFNPQTVQEYRLVGYETRALNREDFNNDKIDAGDMGAGHTVTAIYEFVPVGSTATTIDPLRYAEANSQTRCVGQEGKRCAPDVPAKPVEAMPSNGEYAFVKIRYKLPNEDVSKLIETPVIPPKDCGPTENCIPAVSDDARFSVAVAGFGQILHGDSNTGTFTLDDVIAMAQSAKGEDPFGYRAEFINLVRLAKSTQH